MKSSKLIAAVAARHIKWQLSSNLGGTPRFCIVGLHTSLICSIAAAAHSDDDLRRDVLIRIPNAWHPEFKLPPEFYSNESITHWRHCQLPKGKRSVLFAANPEEIQVNQKSMEKVAKIESSTLRTLYDYWIQESGLQDTLKCPTKCKVLLVALQAVTKNFAARTIDQFADFIIRIEEATNKQQLPLPKAIDAALPALQLPRNSGRFDLIPESRRSTVSAWSKIFRRLRDNTRPLLYRENKNRESIGEQIANNFDSMCDANRFYDHQAVIIKEFLSSDLSRDEWKPCQEKLVELDWADISEVFEGIPTGKAKSLGERTLHFFEEEFPDELQDDEVELLKRRFPREASGTLKDLFERRREQLSRSLKLYAQWERYIFKNQKPYSDFFVGLVFTLHHLLDGIEQVGNNSDTSLVVQIRQGKEKSFWRKKNATLMRYFALRYRGIQKLFGQHVKFDFGRIEEFYLPKPDSDLAKVNSRLVEARSIKFEVLLKQTQVQSKSMFTWQMPLDAVAANMPNDLFDIAGTEATSVLLATADVTKQSTNATGQLQEINLSDLNSIRDADGSSSGVMINPDEGDRRSTIVDALRELSDTMPHESYRHLYQRFHSFTNSYGQAIHSWVSPDGDGISSESFVEQAEAFADFLAALGKFANNDLAHDKLWRECLRIGIAIVKDELPSAIVLPWHPLRLAEIHIKACQTAKLVKNVLSANKESVFRADLLFEETVVELQSVYYPEVCVGYSKENKPCLLSVIDNHFDYSLAQLPDRQTRQHIKHKLESDETAEAVSSVCKQFLRLVPHERNNFSIILYNTMSKSLPAALTKQFSKMLEEEHDLKCNLFLAQSDSLEMRKVFEQQNSSVENDSGSVISSDAARNFLSRMRIGVLGSSSIAESGGIRISDVVALQGLIASKADISWKAAPLHCPAELLSHVPRRWSRRKPITSVDKKASVYLTSPAQPRIGQIYLNTIFLFVQRQDALSGGMIPARDIDFANRSIRETFDIVHKIGEWIINYDELVDRRLLQKNGFEVIRHVNECSTGRNITVSTTSSTHLLKFLLRKRVDSIDSTILAKHGEKPIVKLVTQATQLSGQVVMRAALHSHYASELLGIVLAMEQIKSIVGHSNIPIGWYFLDDYASWFGQKEEVIADVMAIAPRVDAGKHFLRIVIAEAKFVSSQGYRRHAKKSALQLRETVERLRRSLDSGCERIDREFWLHRIGDFMLNGMEQFDSTGTDWDLYRWSDAVRYDKVEIVLDGHSLVFVHDNEETVDATGPELLDKTTCCYQQIFDKAEVAALLRSFAEGHELPDKPSQMLPSEPPKTPPDSLENPVAGPTTPPPVQHSTPPSSTSLVESKYCSEEFSEWIDTYDNVEDANENWLNSTVFALQRALRGYDMTAQLVGSRLTPNAALVRLRGSDDLTVPKVEKRRQELLTSHAIQVISVVAAPNEVVISVARPKRAILNLRDTWRKRELPATAPDSNTSLMLGRRESNGEFLYLNVGDGFANLNPHGPHTLIAGETGSGKGVLVQCLLLDICATNSPTSAQIHMIDPKSGIDFPWLKQMPHLQGDIITVQEEAIQTLEKLVAEMERRNRLLANAGATKLAKYNSQLAPENRLPRIWLFHDEMADWMLNDEYRDAVSLNVSRLGVKSRAAGINIVAITQRPDNKAMPMQFRANLTNRLVLKVADKRNSELVLDEAGAETLLGRGHLAAKLSGEGGIIYAQVPFADEDEMAEAAKLIAAAWKNK